MRPTANLAGLALLFAAIGVSGPMRAETTLDCPGGPQGGVVGGAKSGAIYPTVDVVLPRLIDRVEPLYPESARTSRIEGKVVLQVIVDRGGRAGGIEILNCQVTPLREEIDEEASKVACASFAAAASDAVERWRYEPALQDEKPVCIYYTIRVDFRLGKPGENPKKTIQAG